MSLTAIVVNALVAALLLVSLNKSREKTLTALKIALNAGRRMAPAVFAIIAVIGLIMGFLPRGWIASSMGTERGFIGVLVAAGLGAVLFIPAIVAFPLAGSVLRMGASIMAVAAFITTLTMVGFVFLPLEFKELGRRFAVIRNTMSFVIAIAVSMLMGIFLS